MLNSKPKNINPDFKNVVIVNNISYSLKINNNLLNFYHIDDKKEEIQEIIELKDIIKDYLIINKKINETLLDSTKANIINSIMFNLDKLSNITPFMQNCEILYEFGKIIKIISREYLKEFNLSNNDIIFVIEFIKSIITHILNVFDKTTIDRDQNIKYIKLCSSLVYKFTLLTNIVIDINNELYNTIQISLNEISNIHKVVSDKINTLVNI
jgi:hypothetical protein